MASYKLSELAEEDLRLIITLPISWKGTLAQYAGRIHRSFEDKNAVQIYDYVEPNVPMLSRMYQKREKGYVAPGYEVLLDSSV